MKNGMSGGLVMAKNGKVDQQLLVVIRSYKPAPNLNIPMRAVMDHRKKKKKKKKKKKRRRRRKKKVISWDFGNERREQGHRASLLHS
jgi:hypothetical protein